MARFETGLDQDAGNYASRPAGPLLIALVLGGAVASVLLVVFLFVSKFTFFASSSPQVNLQPESAAEVTELVLEPFRSFGTPQASQILFGPFSDHPLIAHAGGAWRSDGEALTYTNSLEALEQNYELGFRFFEVDVQPTSDGKLALIHDWRTFDLKDKPLSSAEWKAFGIPAGKDVLTSMLFSDLLEFLQLHQDAIAIIDTKDYASSAVEANVHLAIMRAEVEERDARLLERIIPYTYGIDYTNVVTELRFFPHIAFTAYASDSTADELADHILGTQNICMACADVSDSRLTPELVRRLEEGGVAVYAFTVNDPAEADAFRARGVSGFITDTLSPLS